MAFNKDEPVYRQIERQADLYQPSVYQMLSFYQALETETEPMDGKFIPLTSVTPLSPRKTKIFAVGILPPPSFVTARVLDRSASLQSASYGPVTDSAEVIAAAQVEEVQGNAVNDPAFVSTGPDTSVFTPARGVFAKSAALTNELHPSIQPLIQKLIELAAQQGINLVVVQGFRSIEYQDGLYAQGRTAPGNIVTGTKGGESWHNFGLAFDVAMISPGPDPRAGDPTWPKGIEHWRVVGALGQSIGLIWGGTFSKIADYGHFEYHPGITKAQARTGARPEVQAGLPIPLADTALPATKWKSEGAANKDKATKTIAQVADRDLNQTNLGKAFAAAQESSIKRMRDQLEQMARTPPLRLLVNPQSFRVSAEKVISSGNWGRNGPIIEHWGENQDKIEGSGKIAAYYSMDASNHAAMGLSRTARQFSTSYQNLLSLFLIYKNNGGVWFDDPLVATTSGAKNLSVVGSVYLYYDEILYIGSFDNLNLSESDGAPFTLEYTFSFTVRAWYLLDHLDDPQYTFSYGLNLPPSEPVGAPGSPFSGGDYPQPNPNVPLPEGATERRTPGALPEGATAVV